MPAAPLQIARCDRSDRPSAFADVYVAAGVITIALCSLPKLLERQGSFNEQGAWRQEAERRVAERAQRARY